MPLWYICAVGQFGPNILHDPKEKHGVGKSPVDLAGSFYFCLNNVDTAFGRCYL
jgi:hypothetical protein